MSRKLSGEVHRFGGDWTTRKLDVLAGYLRSYTTALKNRPFEKLYIDAFAGTGYREVRGDDQDGATTATLLFPDLAEPEPQKLLDGSARLALMTTPRFDRYVFIERDAGRCIQLGMLKTEFPELATRIEIREGEANALVRDLCTENWRSRRAVLFLDPYGMQVEWATIEAVAQTQAVDLWLLFPLGMGVNRLLKKSGDIPKSWRRRLDLLLGTTDWYDEFYTTDINPTLFEMNEAPVKASTEVIGQYFRRRLESVFPGVAAKPGVLRNKRNVPLYLLCFAAANPGKGKDLALGIANHLLKGMN